MRHIKTYKIFESLDSRDVLITSRDILADLEDDGFRVSTRIFDLNGRSYFSIHISHIDTKFYSDIQRTIDHLKSFLKENGYGLWSVQNFVDEIRVYFSSQPDEELGRLELMFDKFIK